MGCVRHNIFPTIISLMAIDMKIALFVNFDEQL